MIEDRFTELLGKKLTDALTPDELREFNALVSGNPFYRAEYDALKTYWQQNDAQSANMLSIFENIKRQTGIHGQESRKIVPLKRQIKIWQKIAAAFVAVTILAALYTFYFTPDTNTTDTISNWKQLQTPSRSTSKITLNDGTQVMLNAESSLKYPAVFNGETREVYLSGEAFFEVTKDHKHPFIVHTPQTSIRVLGTEFNVKAYENDKAHETTLLRGSIQVTFLNKPSVKVLLKPKQKLVIQKTAYYIKPQTYYNTQDSSIVETAWMNHKLIFKDQSLEELANSLSRKYGVKILFKRDDLRAYKFTGEFEKEDLNQALLSLQIIMPFKYKSIGDNVYLY